MIAKVYIPDGPFLCQGGSSRMPPTMGSEIPISGRKGFPNPNRILPKDSETPIKMGREAEKILDYWAGLIIVDAKTTKEIQLQLKHLTDCIGPFVSHSLDYAEYFIAMKLAWQETFRMGFLNLVDHALHTELDRVSQELPDCGTMSNGRTHVLSTAMALARQVVAPSYEFLNSRYSIGDKSTIKIPGTFVPKTRLGVWGEYDGVVVPENNIKLAGFDLRQRLRDGDREYLPFELKNVLRPRYGTGLRKIKNPFSWDIKQVRCRLRNCVENWSEDGLFPLPREILVIYLRGLLPPISHHVNINGEFWSEWYDDVTRITESKPKGSADENWLTMMIETAGLDPYVGNFRQFSNIGPDEPDKLKQKTFLFGKRGRPYYREVKWEETLTKTERRKLMKKNEEIKIVPEEVKPKKGTEITTE